KNNASFEEEDHHYESIYVEMDDQIEKNSNSDSDESLYVNMEFQTDEKGIVNVQL
ncbi:hypothetical protein Bpfe_005400, partial [Biomphalaria pfeifferi]